jgi:GNAT superfamily N-acetyltransferase
MRLRPATADDLDGIDTVFARARDDMFTHIYAFPHGRGAGSALLERAKELRPSGFRLWVFQRNEGARRFYERHGLRLVRLTDGAGNEHGEPDAMYEWPASAVSPARARAGSGRARSAR